jgi:hypothetical protein
VNLLSNKEGRFVLLMMGAIFVLIPFTHSAVDTNTMLVEGRTTTSIAEPAMELQELAYEKGVLDMHWSVYWRGTLQPHDYERWEELLKHSESYQPLPDNHSLSANRHHQGQGAVQEWSKRDSSGHHHVKIVFTSQQKDTNPTFIYTWQGHQKMDHAWREAYDQLEKIFFNQLAEEPQKFACLEGIASDTLRNDLDLISWVTDDLNGKVIHRVSDSRYVSINGYAKEWDHHSLSAGGRDMNVQLSARHNELEDQTRITIGYPLILTEH